MVYFRGIVYNIIKRLGNNNLQLHCIHVQTPQKPPNASLILTRKRAHSKCIIGVRAPNSLPWSSSGVCTMSKVSCIIVISITISVVKITTDTPGSYSLDTPYTSIQLPIKDLKTGCLVVIHKYYNTNDVTLLTISIQQCKTVNNGKTNNLSFSMK